eukprot:12517085-Alexandrium_andersonii.AAC.1
MRACRATQGPGTLAPTLVRAQAEVNARVRMHGRVLARVLRVCGVRVRAFVHACVCSVNASFNGLRQSLRVRWLAGWAGR